MTRLALTLLVLAAPAALAQTTTVLDADAFASGPLLHDGRVAYVRKMPDGAMRLVRLDPATGRTTETPLPAPDGGLEYTHIQTAAGRLYIGTWDAGAEGLGPLLALDGPDFQPTPADAASAAGRGLPEAGPREFTTIAGDDDANGLAEIGADGRVTPLEPAPPSGYRGVLYPTALSDAVYFAVEALDGDDYVKTLWRASGGQSAPSGVLPDGAGDVSGVAAAGGALLVASRDRASNLVHVFRLAPGAARATPLPGFATPLGFSQGLFRTVGDVLFFTAPEPGRDAGGDSGPRLRLYRQRGTAAPAVVPDLDLGASATFFADAVREFDGALYVASYTPADDDPYGTMRSVFRVGPDGPPRLAARIEGEGSSPQISRGDAPFVVAGGTLFFILQTDAGDEVLASVPLAGQAPSRTRRGRRR